MTDPLLSAAIKEAYASAPVDQVIIDTVQLDHPAFTEPLRVALANDDLVATLEDGVTVATFTSFAFTVQFPEMTDSSPAPEFVLKLDGVSRDVIMQVDAAVETLDPVKMTYRAYLSTDLTGPQNIPMDIDIISVHADIFTVEAHCALPNMANCSFPFETYTAQRFPGLVA